MSINNSNYSRADRATLMLSFILTVLIVCSFVIALFPESPARLLTPAEGWELNGSESSRVLLQEFPEQLRQIRRSAVKSDGGEIFRSWTPENGVSPLEVVSGPFYPTRYMSVVITGINLTPEASNQSYIECEHSGQRLEIFRGGVNVNVAEAIIIAPSDWCAGTARLTFKSSERGTNVGVGAVFEISVLSYLKTSFLGRVPYFMVSLAILSLLMLAGASLGIRLGWHSDPVPIALISLGISALVVFYIISSAPSEWSWISVAIMIAASGYAFARSGREVSIKTAQALLPYARVWFLVSTLYFSILGLVTNGIGHWEPNYRFWPAIWSSDNELPWMFAEALRHGWNLKGLFGGGWLPTDRPPLMAGAYLLLADVFSWLQAGNDGTYMRGQAYNAAAIVLNALWAPVVLWLLMTLHRGMDNRGRTAILAFLGCLPFTLFNTVYGWPKAFGAAFALMAFGLAWQSRVRNSEISAQSTIFLFFAFGAFSMLAHASAALFLAPLGLLFLWWSLQCNLRSVLSGLSIALAMLASWSLYKLLVLPSADPITKYALTGDYGFGRPDWSLWHMLSSRYSDMTFWQWLEIKWTMLLQAFMPLHHSIAQIGLNSDYGAGSIDKLRAWDFMLMSKGNLAVPFLVTMSVLVAIRAFSLRRLDVIHNLMPFFALIGISVVAWLLIVLGFLVPPVGPVWPQAAIFGLALGSAVVVYDYYPALFSITLLSVMIYMAVVWILSPLQSALGIDVGAVVVLTTLGCYIWMLKLWPRSSLVLKKSCTSSSAALFFDAVTAGLRANSTFQRIGNAAVWSHVMQMIVLVALLFSSYIAIRYIQQPLADAHAFRQTQTAQTAYWILKEGWTLAYQTPIAGFPWSIPFEFPIYQMLVAGIAATTDLDLVMIGRFVSYAFLVACAWPAFAVSRRLNFPKTIPLVFCALMWTSPLYVYWGRTFMVETTALFFSLACIPYGIDLIRRTGGCRSTFLFIFFASSAVLQKVTTGGPVLLFLSIIAVFVQLRKYGFQYQALRQLVFPLAIVAVPLVIGWAWAHYSDLIKEANPFGRQLTSKALIAWNFGTIEQKLDLKTWGLIVWVRSLGWNAGGALGGLLLLLPWLGGREYRRYAWLSLAALVLFVLPFLIFTNVHFIHEYYQVACVAFLLAALSIVIGGWLREVSNILAIVPLVTAVIIISNLAFFNSTYGIVAARSLDELDPRSVQAYKVGRYLREHTREGTGIVIFGQDYSSEISFQAQRKSITVPPWFNEYEQVWVDPQKYLGDLEVTAIVICPPTEQFPTKHDLQERLIREPKWLHQTVYGCELLLSSATEVSK